MRLAAWLAQHEKYGQFPVRELEGLLLLWLESINQKQAEPELKLVRSQGGNGKVVLIDIPDRLLEDDDDDPATQQAAVEAGGAKVDQANDAAESAGKAAVDAASSAVSGAAASAFRRLRRFVPRRLQLLADLLEERSVTCKYLVELYGVGQSRAALKEDVRRNVDPKLFQQIIADNGGTFAWICDIAGKMEPIPEQTRWMLEYQFLFSDDLREKANLKEPGVSFGLFEDVIDVKSGLSACAIGRCLVKRPKGAKRTHLHKYRLPDRPVLGPTTLENSLAFLLCNIAGVSKSKAVLDPFCGTGGILLSAAALGGTCFGTDLDRRVLRGWGVAYQNDRVEAQQPAAKSPPGSIYVNFRHYGLPLPEIGRVDSLACYLWRGGSGWADCIVTDPPYGIRAMVRAADGESPGKEGGATRKCAVSDIFRTLLKTATTTLRPGGLLVFLYPHKADEDAPRQDQAPEAPAEQAPAPSLGGEGLRELWAAREDARRAAFVAALPQSLKLHLQVAEGEHGLELYREPCYQHLHGNTGRYAVFLRKKSVLR